MSPDGFDELLLLFKWLHLLHCLPLLHIAFRLHHCINRFLLRFPKPCGAILVHPSSRINTPTESQTGNSLDPRTNKNHHPPSSWIANYVDISILFGILQIDSICTMFPTVNQCLLLITPLINPYQTNTQPSIAYKYPSLAQLTWNICRSCGAHSL